MRKTHGIVEHSTAKSARLSSYTPDELHAGLWPCAILPSARCPCWDEGHVEPRAAYAAGLPFASNTMHTQ